MQKNKLIIAILIGTTCADQLPMMNMIGAGMLKTGQNEVNQNINNFNETLIRALDTNESRCLNETFTVWNNTAEV